MSPLVLERQEHEMALRVRAFLAGSAHQGCGGWWREADGRVICSCTATLLLTHGGTGGSAVTATDAATERDELRAIVREAHEVLGDLRREVKAAREIIGELAAGAVRTEIESQVEAQLQILGEGTRKAMAQSVAKVGKEFDRLEAIFLGRDRETRRAGKPFIEALLRDRAGEPS